MITSEAHGDDEVKFKDLYLDSKRFPKVGDTNFDVPEGILAKPHYIFGYHVVVLYDTDEEALTELSEGFQVTGQALWTWRREGLPVGRKEQAKALIADTETKFRLASNVNLDQLVRPYAGAKKRATNKPPKTNEKWLDLLCQIETGKIHGLTRDDIPKLLSKHSGPPLPTWSPYRWGWENGGVPPSYARSIWDALMGLGLHEVMRLTKEDFIEHCNQHYRAPTRIRQ